MFPVKREVAAIRLPEARGAARSHSSIDQQRKLPTCSLQTQNFGAPSMRITTGRAATTPPTTPVWDQNTLSLGAWTSRYMA
jgi:hypothetical protein